MRGLTVLIVLCAVVALLVGSPALAGDVKQKDAAVPAVQKAAVQKSVSQPAAVKGVRCDGGVCPFAAVVNVPVKVKVVAARVGARTVRQGVRLNCPLRGGCCGK